MMGQGKMEPPASGNAMAGQPIATGSNPGAPPADMAQIKSELARLDAERHRAGDGRGAGAKGRDPPTRIPQVQQRHLRAGARKGPEVSEVVVATG